MSRKNFMHQADLLFSNANGTTGTTYTKGVSNPMPVINEPSKPIGNPKPTILDERKRQLELDAIAKKKMLADIEAKKKAGYDISKKPTYNDTAITSKPYSPVEPLRPEAPKPELPIMPSEPTSPETPIVSDGYPMPKPTVVINNNPDTTRVDSVGNGGIGTAISSGGNGGSEKEILKKDFIPLLLTVAGLLIIAFKPIKQ